MKISDQIAKNRLDQVRSQANNFLREHASYRVITQIERGNPYYADLQFVDIIWISLLYRLEEQGYPIPWET